MRGKMSVAYGQYYPIVATNTAAAAACPYFCTCKPTIWQCSSSSSMTWPLDNQPHVIVRGVKMLDMTGSDVNVLPNWRPTHNFPDLQLIFLVNTIFDGYQCRELECLEKLGLKIIAPRCGKDKRNGCAYAPCCPWSSRPTPTGFPTPWPLPYPPKVFTTTHAAAAITTTTAGAVAPAASTKIVQATITSPAPLLITVRQESKSSSSSSSSSSSTTTTTTTESAFTSSDDSAYVVSPVLTDAATAVIDPTTIKISNLSSTLSMLLSPPADIRFEINNIHPSSVPLSTEIENEWTPAAALARLLLPHIR
ncbi:hormone receptor 4-like [Paramacrobiotus metropolitanus]|uniref:hormone receptor 4-like n=1 Tax=Paramacrobiotus metropolitanus TaxID=2943436 RepID=UPI002445F453|nr:hormone receptor 4-like [Paramacrobiotus metropolitanus]